MTNHLNRETRVSLLPKNASPCFLFSSARNHAHSHHIWPLQSSIPIAASIAFCTQSDLGIHWAKLAHHRREPRSVPPHRSQHRPRPTLPASCASAPPHSCVTPFSPSLLWWERKEETERKNKRDQKEKNKTEEGEEHGKKEKRGRKRKEKKNKRIGTVCSL